MKWNNRGHEYDEVGNHLLEIRTVYIYGSEYKDSYFLKRMGLRVVFIITPEEYEQIHIKENYETFDSFLSFPKGDHVILFPIYYQDFDRLESLGYRLDYDYFIYDTQYRTNKFMELYLLYKYDFLLLPSLPLLCTTVCNLNCKACLNFTQYNKNLRHFQFDKLTNSMDILFKHVDFLSWLQLGGGEPLLYPYLADLCKYVGTNYRERIGELTIVTNGTQIPSDTLCASMSQYDIKLEIDDYSPNVENKVGEIERKCRSYNLRTQIYKPGLWIDLSPMTTDNFNKSESELIEHFNGCDNPWNDYSNGKLYSCNWAHFAEEAGIAESDPDLFFDLDRTDISKKEIYEFRMHYTPNGYLQFCKRCSGRNNNPHHLPAAIQLPSNS